MICRTIVALEGAGVVLTAVLLLTIGCGGSTTTPSDPMPFCLLTPAQLDFDSVKVGQVKDLEFTIQNAGDGTLSGSVTETCTPFSIVSGGGEFALTAGSERTVVVRFAPTVAEGHACTVSLGGTVCESVSCSGTGSPLTPMPGGMVLVPAGAFLMGSPIGELGRVNNEIPHEVTLSRALYVSVHEVTQSAWFAVMGWNESFVAGARRPVTDVTWFDCVAYLNQRSEDDGYTPAYAVTNETRDGVHITQATVTWNREANGYRFLTEAEWEYACRATTQTAFHSGEITNPACAEPNLGLVGWYCGNASGTAHEVGERAANSWGLKDMHGNVREWCWDRYGDYPNGPATDPGGPDAGTERVTRGGSWNHHAQFCRSAYRSQSEPGRVDHVVGLRLARTVR